MTLKPPDNLWRYHPKLQKEQWREVAYYVDHHATETDVVLFYVGFCRSPFDYYSKRTDLVKQALQAVPSEEEATAQVTSVLKDTHGPVWIVLCEDQKGRQRLIQALYRVFPSLVHRHYVGVDLLQ